MIIVRLECINLMGADMLTLKVEIGKAFMEVAAKSPHFKDAKLNVGCGGYKCCFNARKYATWTHFPFYESK